MALSTTHVLPYPIKNARFSFLLEWRDANGALTNPTSPDTEYSTDGGASFADCAEEVAPTGGHGYMTLTGAETNSAMVKVQSKGTGVLTATAEVYPRELAAVHSGTAQAGAASSITLAAGASAVDDYYTGCIVRTSGGTGGGGTGGTNNQARVITDYVGATRVATIGSANWEVVPDLTTTYDVLATEEWVQGMFERLMANLDTAVSTRHVDGAEVASVAGAVGSVASTVSASLTQILGADLTETGGGYLATAFKKLFDVETPLLVASEAMRGTEGAALASAYTAARAVYLDSLNLGGLAASQADIQGITQAQRVRVCPPALMERPDSGSTTYRLWIYAYDEQHQAEDLDSDPTVTAENNLGADRSGNLGTVTKPGGTTGQYYVDYTVANDHAIEGLVFKVNATEGGVTTQYPGASIVVDTTAVDFTSADRVKLNALHDDRLTAARAGYLDKLNVAGTLAQVGSLMGLADSAITDAKIAIDAITSAKIATGAISNAQFAANAINAGVIAADAIGSSELAASAAQEIADAVLVRAAKNVENIAGGDTLAGLIAIGTKKHKATFTDNGNGTGTFTVYKADGITTWFTGTMDLTTPSATTPNVVTGVQDTVT